LTAQENPEDEAAQAVLENQVLRGPALWQANRLSARLVAVEAINRQQAEQIDVLTKQRDDALRKAPKRPFVAPEVSEEIILRLRRERDAAIAERDEARAAWDRLRAANAELVAQLAWLETQIDALKAQLASKPAATAAPVAKKPKPAQQLPDVEQVEPSPQEVALEQQRAELVLKLKAAEAESKKWGGHHNGFQARVQVTQLQAEISAFKPRLQAHRQVRHAELQRRQAAAQLEALA
jgi:hypothetical protein